jgi:site-specific DNA recombinase
LTGSARIQRIREHANRRTETQQVLAQKAVGYIRVSTDEQSNNGLGLEAQEAAIRAFAESQGYDLVEIVADPGVSGATRPATRPGFSRVLALAEKQAFSILLVWKFDRLARSLEYAVTTTSGLQEQLGITLRSVTEPIDTATPTGQIIFAVLAGFAAQERESIIDRTIAGKKQKASRGGYVGGFTPYGYRRDKEGGLMIDEQEAAVVRRIASMRQSGATLQSISDALNAEGIPGRRGGSWYARTISYVLDNPRYKGLVECYFQHGGEQHILTEGQHEAILPRTE